jgi:hypothetical protein
MEQFTMQLRSYKTLSAVAGVLFVVCGLAEGQKEAQYLHNPQVYDAHSGHIIPLALRGTGTVYLTLAEAQSLNPYIYAEYSIVALAALILGGGLVYQRFWRRRRGRSV